MKLTIQNVFCFIGLWLMSCASLIAQESNSHEMKIDLTPFGFKPDHCLSYKFAHFLDDEHIVLSTAFLQKCGISNWRKPLPTQLTIIDLNGKVQTTIKRDDVVETKAGPIGYVIVCTESSIEFLGKDLTDGKSIPSDSDACSSIKGLSPSRTAISFWDRFDKSSNPVSHARLFHGLSNEPIAELVHSKNQKIIAITDNGYAVCEGEHGQCTKFTVNGVEWKGPMQFNIAGFLTNDQLLVYDYAGNTLYSVSPEGKQTPVADIRKYKPPFMGSNYVSLSATEPRRILYSVTGCLLGDFDDCYGVFFHQFVVFDSTTHQPLFHHNFKPESSLSISPDGHHVIVLDETVLHIYYIP